MDMKIIETTQLSFLFQARDDFTVLQNAAIEQFSWIQWNLMNLNIHAA